MIPGRVGPSGWWSGVRWNALFVFGQRFLDGPFAREAGLPGLERHGDAGGAPKNDLEDEASGAGVEISKNHLLSFQVALRARTTTYWFKLTRMPTL